jgi:hypothetical protein
MYEPTLVHKKLAPTPLIAAPKPAAMYFTYFDVPVAKKPDR